MELSHRKKLILKAVVESFVETAEPVSSKALQEFLSVSSATIRNEMSELVELGLLEQPHTSAGRVPTALGYRIYVDTLMGQSNLTPKEAEAITHKLHPTAESFDQVVTRASKLASELTTLPSYAQLTLRAALTAERFEFVYIDKHSFILVLLLSNKAVHNKLIHLPQPISQTILHKLTALFCANFTAKVETEITQELILATEQAAGDTIGLTAVIAGFLLQVLLGAKVRQTMVQGTSTLLDHPEFQDISRAKQVLGLLSNEQELIRLPAPDEDGIKILIGPENIANELKNTSVVVAKYDAGDNMQGIIGVLGPTRMDYAKVAAKLSYIAGGIANVLSAQHPILPEERNRGGISDDK